jgi:hypothetical protein
MSKRDRIKLSNTLHPEGTRFSKPWVSFYEAFPQIEDIEFTVNEHHGIMGPLVFNRDTFKECYDCCDSLCVKGGFRMGEIVRSMVAKGETDKSEKYIPCQGNYGSPKGKVIYKPCTNYFDIDVKIKYKKNV